MSTAVKPSMANRPFQSSAWFVNPVTHSLRSVETIVDGFVETDIVGTPNYDGDEGSINSIVLT